MERTSEWHLQRIRVDVPSIITNRSTMIPSAIYLAGWCGLAGLAIIHGCQTGQVKGCDAVKRAQRVEYRRRRSHRRRRHRHSLPRSVYCTALLRETYSTTWKHSIASYAAHVSAGLSRSRCVGLRETSSRAKRVSHLEILECCHDTSRSVRRRVSWWLIIACSSPRIA